MSFFGLFSLRSHSWIINVLDKKLPDAHSLAAAFLSSLAFPQPLQLYIFFGPISFEFVGDSEYGLSLRYHISSLGFMMALPLHDKFPHQHRLALFYGEMASYAAACIGRC